MSNEKITGSWTGNQVEPDHEVSPEEQSNYIIWDFL